MLAQIITENGTKKLKPLTADAGAGAPVGTIIVVCSNRVPSNYLPLGTQFDTTQYPLLYAELGTDTTPTASSLNLPTLSSGQYVIKATSGLTEGQQDDVANIINGERSYSTTEINTGKKWIDGKPIYRKVVDFGALPNNAEKTVAHNLTNVDNFMLITAIAYDTSGNYLPIPYADTYQIGYSIRLMANKTNVIIQTGYNRSTYTKTYVTLEYTKTTD